MTSPDKGGMLKNKELTEAQRDFLEVCEELQWGKLEVLVQKGEPSYSRLIEKTYQHKKSKP